jgi:HEAT repeat protein
MTFAAALRDLQDADPRARARAADALGHSEEANRAQAVAALERAAEDAHPSVRYAALLSLGELEAPAAAETLIRHLGDGEPLCREAAAIALGQVGPEAGPAAWEALVAALASDRPELRFQAIASLAEIDDTRAAPLVAPLLEDADVEVRAQAAAALGDGNRAARPFLDALAARLGDERAVRHEAALALARLGDRRGIPTLVLALGDREQALDAATALAEIGVEGNPEATAALARVLSRTFGDRLVKVRAAEALARAGDPRGRAHLARAARARRDDVRGLAQSVLSNLDASTDR